MGSPVSPVTANIYIQYYEEMALCPECTIPSPWWKTYVNNVVNVVKKGVETLFNHLNSVDHQIRFTMEAPHNDGIISFLDTKCSPSSYYTIHTSVFRKLIHTYCH